MSIKGIDAQIMITRTAELARDSSAQLRRNELMQDYLAAQTRALETQEKKSVAKTLNTQKGELRPDNDREGNGRDWSGDEREAGEREQADQEQFARLAPTGPHTIDITI